MPHRSSILVTCCHAPFVWKVCFKRRNRVQSDNRESCVWSCGAPRRLFLGADVGSQSSSSSCEAEPPCSISGWAAVSLYCLLPRLVRCLGCILQIQPGSGSLCIIKSVEKGGSGRSERSAAPAAVAPARVRLSRIMSRIHGLVAMRELRGVLGGQHRVLFWS